MAAAGGPAPLLASAPPSLVSDLVRFAMMAGDRLQAGNLRRLALVGTALGEGTTTVTCLLGQVLAAHQGLRELLIDGNAPHPDLPRATGVEADTGWRARLAEPPEAVCLPTPWPNVWVCPQGPPPEDRAAVPDAAADPTAFLDRCAAAYDMVLLDCAPLAFMGDALEMARRADASLLVVEADRLSREVLAHSCATLDGLGAPFLGAVLNRHEHAIPRVLYRHA